jgi:hypothetical protein
MLADFAKGFWVSVYRDRVVDVSLPTMRIMTGNMPSDVALPNDGLRKTRGYSGRFMVKLLTTWVRMGFRTPQIAGLSNG